MRRRRTSEKNDSFSHLNSSQKYPTYLHSHETTESANTDLNPENEIPQPSPAEEADRVLLYVKQKLDGIRKIGKTFIPNQNYQYSQTSNLSDNQAINDIQQELGSDPTPMECVICGHKYDILEVSITTPCCGFSCHLRCIVEKVQNEGKRSASCPKCHSHIPVSYTKSYLALQKTALELEQKLRSEL
ncbi:hypothetical protein TRFO_04745 [Tritrichomonas foetus]|uniref:RING-type domain-containing protein n=1 Tax=Tritrichomonas foetus TaxID=1144522 RepID=A0A1J4KH64_9EUKA|nr:hypothetical protein TRFO_04745 [Tritrichomonas foetus]|eukprot:OHT08685.1 hypothetical protein TRFO_04745 [Tritrichomonas foetus]